MELWFIWTQLYSNAWWSLLWLLHWVQSGVENALAKKFVEVPRTLIRSPSKLSFTSCHTLASLPSFLPIPSFPTLGSSLHPSLTIIASIRNFDSVYWRIKLKINSTTHWSANLPFRAARWCMCASVASSAQRKYRPAARRASLPQVQAFQREEGFVVYIC